MRRCTKLSSGSSGVVIVREPASASSRFGSSPVYAGGKIGDVSNDKRCRVQRVRPCSCLPCEQPTQYDVGRDEGISHATDRYPERLHSTQSPRIKPMLAFPSNAHKARKDHERRSRGGIEDIGGTWWTLSTCVATRRREWRGMEEEESEERTVCSWMDGSEERDGRGRLLEEVSESGLGEARSRGRGLALGPAELAEPRLPGCLHFRCSQPQLLPAYGQRAAHPSPDFAGQIHGAEPCLLRCLVGISPSCQTVRTCTGTVRVLPVLRRLDYPRCSQPVRWRSSS